MAIKVDRLNSRYACFEKLNSPHLITTIDYGNFDVKALILSANSYCAFLREFFQANSLIIARVQHQNNIAIIHNKYNRTVVDADGLLYLHFKGRNGNQKKKIIAATTGDCPYLIIEGEIEFFKIVGLVHSGWRSTALNIAAKTIKKIKSLHFPLSCLRIGIWSGICPSCYDVGNDVKEKLSAYPMFFSSNNNKNKWQLNLAGIIKKQLLQTGIVESQIEQLTYCSCCHQNLFFSYRRSIKYNNFSDRKKRNALFIQA